MGIHSVHQHVLTRIKQFIAITSLTLPCLLLSTAHAASVDKGSIGTLSSDNAITNNLTLSGDTTIITQAINPQASGFISNDGGEQWRFSTTDGSYLDNVGGYYIRFDGAPALMGIPAETGTLTVGAGNIINDVWTNRIFSRPVVFVAFADPNLNKGVSIVPTAPITHGNQFLFDIRQAPGFSADLQGATLKYFIAEEGWHRLADGRMLLISSTELKDTGFTGATIELGATFSDAVTVAQLQRPMLYKNSFGFRQLNTIEVYQGATVTSGIGEISSIGLRMMQARSVEEDNGSTVYGGRVGFMVLGNISSIANRFKTVRDTNTNIRGGSYLTVPQTNFQYYQHSAATSPLLNKAACAEDDDVQNFCTYLSVPVDAFSRGIFDTPRLPYVNSDFEPLQMQRTLYSEIEGSWEGTAEAELAAPVTDGDNKPIVGTLAKMFPNFVAARGWDHEIIGSNSYWHWFATYHYNTCVFDSMNTACVDYLPGDTIVQDRAILWQASTVRYDTDDDEYIGIHHSANRAQEIFINLDQGRNDRGLYFERLTPPSWAASETFDYLKFKLPDTNKFISLTSINDSSKELLEIAAEPWQLAFTRTNATASERWCSTCEGIPTFQTGDWRTSESSYYGVAVHSDAYYYGERHINDIWIKPRVSKLGQSMRVGDYLFANIPYGINPQDVYWIRSVTGTRDDAEWIAYGDYGYQATMAEGNHYVTLCMYYNETERCGDWFKVGNIPYAENVAVTTISPTGVDLVGNYTYIAPGDGNYDVESRSPHQWQKLVNGVWLDISGATEQTYVASGSVGLHVRFCVIPRSLDGITGPEVCSAGVVIYGDNDSDGIADHWDSDDDNDGVFDWYDDFPFDNTESLDTDGDGIGNNADLDDDNDGISDEDESAGLTDPLNYDTDGDGTNDLEDPFPTSFGNFPDFDNDGLDDTVDEDRDNDGVIDYYYQVEGKPGLQTLITEDDVVLAWARVDDDPFSPCLANEITVTSNADSGPGTLRQALADLCATEPGADFNTITFSGAMTIALKSPLVITKGMKIDGNREVVIDGQNTTSLFAVVMTDHLMSSQFPHFVGLTLRNGFNQQTDISVELGNPAALTPASAIEMRTASYVMLDFTLIENMTAPVIGGEIYKLYMDNSLIANVTGDEAALVTIDGLISLYSSTIYNSESGTISVLGDGGKAQLQNSLLLNGPSGSTVCDVATWEMQTTSWVEGSECGFTSTGTVVLADPANGDYRPIPGSASIDMGTPGDEGVDTFDLLGAERVLGEYNPDNPVEEGGPIYPQLDVGAIEYDFYGDFDGDGTPDTNDDFPTDATETTDSDGDGVGDNSDALPNDPTETLDTDLDGIGDNADNDDDNDGVEDALDAFPLDASESIDTDNDGIGNNADTDDDNDGVEDALDAFPLDTSESKDTDNDGIGNNADTDDDNDGVEDTSDAFPLDANESLDTDNDGIGNNADSDDDNDGVEDASDAFPLDASESLDTDNDGIGNNADSDDDNDGVEDASDAFPLDASESLDTDNDGIGNNADSDDDNDGVEDSSDAFPLDASEWADSDGDGIGDNSDPDRDGDGIIDTQEPNVAPVVTLVVVQNNQSVSKVYANAGSVTVTALVFDENPLDSHHFNWANSDSMLSITAQTNTIEFDPSALENGVYKISVDVSDNGVGELQTSADFLIKVNAVAPILLPGADSDGDGIPDVDEGYADNDGDRIPDYLDASDKVNELPLISSGVFMQTQEGLQLKLGDVAFAADKTNAQITSQELTEVTGSNKDTGFEIVGQLVDFIISGMEIGTSVNVVIPQSSAIPANATYRKFIDGKGWQAFAIDAKNQVYSAAGALGQCPKVGDESYQLGLTEGHYCVQLTIEDGGANDADGLANGIIHDPSAVAVEIPTPTVSASLNRSEAGNYNQDDGEKTVLNFSITSDSGDAEINSLTLSTSGDMDEVNDIGFVQIYLDVNRDGIATAEEQVGQGKFNEDNGQLTFEFEQAVQLVVGETHFIVSYEF
ncbi:choice-of-anchor U domain-containing protein [Pseudoalteromonas sp. T1lg48]|uniref:choice-of-anchor U domain-containing protein n=1 Tax=Pseudoalteromonas sp. T1lg48 TaxID=2077100 RepID=UPI001F2193CD|nr:choice-of-anchor U domain-containing protein [Pseudoalteromonas sp. T1lg48]